MPLWGRMLRRGGESAYERAVHLFDAGRYQEAITELEAILANPRRSTLTQELARFYLGEAHTALAREEARDPSEEGTVGHLRRALALHPRFPDLHFRLACAYVTRGDEDRAREAVATALELNPHYADARRLQAALEQGQALALVQQKRETQDDEVAVHARLALSLYRQGEFESAADAYRQALALAPTYADLHNQLGVTLHAADRDQEAVSAFTRALEINPTYLEARLNRGIALRHLGELAAAQEDFEQVLARDPQNLAAREERDRMEGR